MAISKVILNGVTQIDVTQKTVTAETMLNGTTALKNDGTDITGNIVSKDSTDLTVSGATVTAPAGYYSAAASKSVASGTAGTPTATKGAVSNHSVSVTPSVTNTTGYITGGTKNGTAVTVSVSELVSGTLSITSSGTKDVTNYASASVAAGSATTPATSVTANPTISVSDTGMITATASASKSVTPTVSAGYVSSGTAGTISVSGSNTQQMSTQAATTITPSTSQQTAVAAGKYTTGAVTVAPIPSQYIIPAGTKTITENGTGIDVAEYESVDVSVSGSSVTVSPLSVTTNGTYTAPSGTAYSPVTVNVEGGGSASVEKKQVNFIDYDGTILYSYTGTEANALTSLPSNPSHSGLVAQGWNWTLAQIKSQLAAIPDGPVWVGQMYITQSGNTEIDITLDNADFLSPYLAIAVNGTVVVNWGDGTATNTVTGSSDNTLTYTQHIYAQTGNYTISISVSSGSFTFYGTSTYASVLRTVNTANNRARNRTYSSTITQIRIGNNTYVGNYAFQYCYALSSITIPDGVTSIGTYAFEYCLALTSITIPDEVTSISTYAFHYCATLKSIAIPDEVTSISTYAFYYCATLKSITIPDGVTSISTYAFEYCLALTSITIPDGVTSIGNNAFQYCYSLKSITIQDGVTSISNNAFYYCYALTSITIPDSVTSIGTNAFNNCYAMEEYHLLPTTPPTLGGTNAFTGIMSGTKIYVPYSADHSILEAYQTATNWSTYASYMEEEPQ